ncbi:HEAT domain containing protein [Chondrocystis sp. NIES-4102]|nr:HEAT domain containing protein [Chondrocystis sp. NIES-4102]
MSEVQQLIEAVNKADSADLLLETVERLAETNNQAAIPTLVEVLGFNNPGAAVAAVDGLIKIGEPVVPYLLANLDDYNYGARAWATRVFAGIGDPCTLNLLIKAAIEDFSQSVRRAATKGLGNIIWSKLPENEVIATQQQVLNTLLQATEDGEWVVRYAAVVGLESLAQTLATNQPQLLSDIAVKLQQLIDRESEPAIRARIQYTLQKL